MAKFDALYKGIKKILKNMETSFLYIVWCTITTGEALASNNLSWFVSLSVPSHIFSLSPARLIPCPVCARNSPWQNKDRHRPVRETHRGHLILQRSMRQPPELDTGEK